MKPLPYKDFKGRTHHMKCPCSACQRWHRQFEEPFDLEDIPWDAISFAFFAAGVFLMLVFLR